MPSPLRKSSDTSLSTCTTWKGPKRVAAGRPKSEVRNSADARGSWEWTMVWFSLMVMGFNLSVSMHSKGLVDYLCFSIAPDNSSMTSNITDRRCHEDPARERKRVLGER